MDRATGNPGRPLSAYNPPVSLRALGRIGVGPTGQQLSPRLRRLIDRLPTWVVFLVAGLWTVPTAGIFVSSLRHWPRHEAGWWTSWFDRSTWTLDGYRGALSLSVNNSFAEGMLNSLTVALLATLVPLLLSAWAAYAIIWIPFRGKTIVFFTMVGLLALPIQVALIPLLQTYSGGAHLTLPVLSRTATLFPDLDLAGTLPAVWLTNIGFALPFAVFLLTVTMSQLPREVIDAARADGAGHAQAFWRIVVPLSVPALAGLGVLLFLWGWNDYLVGFTMVGGGNPEALPATVKLVSYSVPTGGPVLAAAAFLHSTVAMLVFIVLHRYLARSLVLSVQ